MALSRRGVVIGGTAAVLAGIGGGASAAEPDRALVEAARKEGRVVAYGSIITPTWRAIKAGFEQRYPGIQMEFLYLSGAPLLNRLMTELDAGRYLADAFALDVDRLAPLQAKGYIEKYISTEQSHYDERWFSDPPGYWIQNHDYLSGILYNRKLVPEADAPKSFEDLLNPKWRGKLALISPLTNDLIFYLFAGLIRDMGDERAFKLINGIAGQKPLIVGPGGLPLSQGINTGQFPVGIGFLGHMYSVGGGEGGAMAIAATDPVYATSGPGIGLLKNAPHPNAGRLLVDFMNARDVQETVVKLGYFSNYPGVDAPPSLQRLNVVPAPIPTGQEASALKERLRSAFEL